MSRERVDGVSDRYATGLYITGTLVLAGCIAASGFIASGGRMQIAAAAAVSPKDGQCNKQYTYCMRNTPGNLQQNCERLWRGCVSDKCDVSPRIQKCVKDSDCATSCTEAASSKEGVVSCCLLGPKHKNLCLKKIDGKCLAPRQTSPYFSGPKIDEGASTLSEQSKATGEFQIQTQDAAAEIPPSSIFTYPKDTPFDERGLPSQAPMMNSSGAGKILDPDSPSYAGIENYLIENPSGRSEQELPPEYIPHAPYVPSTGERIFTLSGTERNPVIYSDPVESLTENDLRLYRQYPVFTPESQRAPTAGNTGDTFLTSGNIQSSQPASNTCRVSLFSWCFWH